ncbi:class I adenylate-forming enzyme family protein [Actinophytocola gossypii]|uniref:AMP-binding protein n=1 Tax=Actinophytocola gossypii TaxID=2812003 RepID=A0ABT2J6P8_9PSEU|nr:AMP-binding protein [Actinophytocola gossypii]MCT2583537.1 AMP-binding protein [Actinophytocola gossypii]
MHYGTFVTRHATRHPDRVALVDGDRSRTWAEFDERTTRLANALRAKGFARGDRVALVTDNRLECVEVMVAAAKTGLVFVPLDFRLDDDAVAHLLRHSGSRVVFVGRSHREQAARVAGSDTPVEAWLDLDDGYERLLADAASDRVPDDVPDDAGFCVLYTSGTTGMPKGVFFTHQQTMDNAMAVLNEYGVDGESRYLVSYPHNSAGSVNHVFGPVLMAGGRLVFGDVRNFDAERYFATVERERVTHSQLVPTMLFRLLAADDSPYDLSSLTTVGYASAPIPPPRVKQMLDRFGPIFVQAYGMTETCSFAAVLPKADHDVVGTEREGVLASCGRATYGVELAVVDEDDRPVPPGTLGEVVMRGRWLFESYWDDPVLTDTTYRGGWLHSGDVGYLDAEDYLYLVDRKKDLLIIGGANIASKEIEDVLYEVPGVLEAAVVGVPDEEWGERPHAIVAPRPGDAVDVETVLAHCRGRLPSIKRPVAVTVRETMPKTSTGKISKPALRKLVTAEHQ